MIEAVLSHGVTSVRAQAKIRAGRGSTDERETGLLVLGVVAAGVRVIELPCEHSDGAG